MVPRGRRGGTGSQLWWGRALAMLTWAAPTIVLAGGARWVARQGDRIGALTVQMPTCCRRSTQWGFQPTNTVTAMHTKTVRKHNARCVQHQYLAAWLVLVGHGNTQTREKPLSEC